jgi:hypothetical protein
MTFKDCILLCVIRHINYCIVTDLLNTLPGNSSVNTVQHTTIEEAAFL